MVENTEKKYSHLSDSSITSGKSYLGWKNQALLNNNSVLHLEK